MEAKKLRKRKGTINKGQIKRSIKNIICRPDPVFWPAVSEAESEILSNILMQHRICIPEFKRPPWNKLKLIPKNERPKPLPFKQVEGLLFGISVCRKAIENNECSAVLIEALVEPQLIVQPVIEACNSSDTPVICLKDLRVLTKKNFGIQTSCLGIKKDKLLDISNNVKEIYENYKTQEKIIHGNHLESNNLETTKEIEKEDTQMDVELDQSYNPYLFRTDKKIRMFVPSNKQDNVQNNKFVGQNFIELPKQKVENKTDSKAYMRMILKKISGNPNRKVIKQV